MVVFHVTRSELKCIKMPGVNPKGTVCISPDDYRRGVEGVRGKGGGGGFSITQSRRSDDPRFEHDMQISQFHRTQKIKRLALSHSKHSHVFVISRDEQSSCTMTDVQWNRVYINLNSKIPLLPNTPSVNYKWQIQNAHFVLIIFLSY